MSEIFAARVGFEVLQGTGWLVPIVARGDWPLGRFSVTSESLRVTGFYFGMFVEIPWETVSSIEGTWTGIHVKYNQQMKHRELLLYAPFLWRRFEASITHHGLATSDFLSKSSPELENF